MMPMPNYSPTLQKSIYRLQSWRPAVIAGSCFAAKLCSFVDLRIKPCSRCSIDLNSGLNRAAIEKRL